MAEDLAEGPFRQILTICNKRGLHARAAARFVKLADAFDAEIRVAKNGSVVNGRSIMGLMMLAASIGSTIEVRASGRQAREALDAVSVLVSSGFDEE